MCKSLKSSETENQYVQCVFQNNQINEQMNKYVTRGKDDGLVSHKQSRVHNPLSCRPFYLEKKVLYGSNQETKNKMLTSIAACSLDVPLGFPSSGASRFSCGLILTSFSLYRLVAAIRLGPDMDSCATPNTVARD